MRSNSQVLGHKVMAEPNVNSPRQRSRQMPKTGLKHVTEAEILSGLRHTLQLPVQTYHNNN